MHFSKSRNDNCGRGKDWPLLCCLVFCEENGGNGRNIPNPGQAGDEMFFSPRQRSFSSVKIEEPDRLGGPRSSPVSH